MFAAYMLCDNRKKSKAVAVKQNSQKLVCAAFWQLDGLLSCPVPWADVEPAREVSKLGFSMESNS